MRKSDNIIHQKDATPRSSDPLSEVICSTIDFFLPDGRETDAAFSVLVSSFKGWMEHRKTHQTPAEYLSRPKISSSPHRASKPWESDDIRANSPIKLVNHLWSLGWFGKEKPLLLCRLKAFALGFALNENSAVWEKEILTEVLALQYLEKSLYKQGIKNFKQSRAAQTKGLRNAATNKPYLDFERTNLTKRIHERADQLLSSKKPKHEIVGIIASGNIMNLKGTPISKRDVRRYLETHYSGHWKPKNKK